MPSRFGIQPGRELVDRQGHTIKSLAEIIGVTRAHLAGALGGNIVPRTEVREKLPELLGVPLGKLFTAESLEHPFKKGRPYQNLRGEK